MTNPWAQAAATHSSIPMNNDVLLSSEAQQRQRQGEITCWRSTLLLFVRITHVLDGIIGISLVIYGLTILSSHLHIPIFTIMGLGILLLVRALFGLTGIHHDTMHRFGLRISAVYLSPLFGMVDLILSFTCMGKHAILVEYLQQHAAQLHLSEHLVKFISTHHHALWILWMSSAVMEGVRWWTIPILHAWLLQMDNTSALGGSPDVELLYTPISDTKRPWWWQHSHSRENGTLQEPLLVRGQGQGQPHWVHQSNTSRNYSIHDGTSPNTNTSFWSKWFGSPGQKEEEESVDFASVQEEWASRSQEDPFWWSREDGQAQATTSPTANKSNDTSEGRQDLSWATDDRNEQEHDDEMMAL